MISNKNKSIILLGVIMLSSAVFTNSLRENNNNYKKNTAVYSINNKNSESEVSKVSNIAKLDNINVETTNKDKDVNLATINTTNISEKNFAEISSSNNNFSAVDNSALSNNFNVNTSNSNNNITELDNETNKIEENVENSEIANNSEDTKEENSVIESDSTNNENNTSNADTNNDISIVENNITCPPLKDSPTLIVSEGTNKNGVGDSVYDHLKGLGWKVIDENTIRINDDRLQFKNMNGQAGVDSIITIRCDLEENDKYVLYLLKLMIGDKSFSKNDNPNMDAANFDDTYYDNFENLVRRIANGTGTIKYSNRNIRVQYDGNWDYTITLTFYNYADESSNSTPPTIENGAIIY